MNLEESRLFAQAVRLKSAEWVNIHRPVLEEKSGLCKTASMSSDSPSVSFFRRVAIVNRGEAAMRLIHATRELQDDHGFPQAVALHTEAEASSLFVREADDAVQFEPTESNPYLDYAELERALVAANADAAWVGWGFVAEHPDFADLCERLGITFIGPSGDVMRRLGDKIGAKKLAEKCGVPVAAWSDGPVTDLATAQGFVERIGLPLMIKATAGGGGRGIRKVEARSQLAVALERAQSEAQKSFGDPTVFMEKVVTDARHVEVQIAADAVGNVWALGVRDCSAQRRNQKVIEESSSPALTPAQNAMLCESACALVRASGYKNVGTVEFLYQPKTGEFAFLEVNTRLQVEHPVTELTIGFDIVKLQLQIAAGWVLDGHPPAAHGHAIEARLNAEDPARGFAPAPGHIELLDFPMGPGIRVDSGVAEGDTIPAEYDAMIAKIIAWGADRDEALDRLRRALQQTRVVISGGTTNKSFLLDLLSRPELRSGEFTTSWLDEMTEKNEHLAAGSPDVALIAAAIDGWRAERSIDRAAFFASAARGRPQTKESSAGSFACRLAGESYNLSVAALNPSTFQIELDGATVRAHVEPAGRRGSILEVGGRRHQILSVIDGVDHLVEVDGILHRVSRDDGGMIRAASPALVVSVNVEADAEIARGETLVTLESMKVETAVTAPFDGVVREVMVRPNTQVDAGAAMFRIEPSADDAATPDAVSPRASLVSLQAADHVSEDSQAAAARLLDEMRWQVLGYATNAPVETSRTQEYKSLRAAMPNDARLLDGELSVLDAFSDLIAVSRNRRADAEFDAESHSPKEFLHHWLRARDSDAEGLPEAFITKVDAALGHYGVNLDQAEDDAIEAAAFNLFHGQQSAGDHTALILALLNIIPTAADRSEGEQKRLRSSLDRLISASQLRFPLLGEAARNLRYRVFDKPILDASTEAGFSEMRDHLDALADNPDATDRSDRVRSLVAFPHRLIRLFGDRSASGELADRTPLLEVLTRRNYQQHALERFRLGRMNNRLVLTVGYQHDDQQFHVVATSLPAAEMEDAIGAVGSIASKAPRTDTLLVDLYIRDVDADETEEGLLATVGEALRNQTLPPVVRRVTVSGVVDDVFGNSAVLYVTFRRDGAEFVEDRPIRGMHPTIAQRLHLWRFENFDVERLDSPDDTYLFQATGREEPHEVRLFGAAEVRDLTPVRDANGHITSLPELEIRLLSVLSSLRAARAEYPTRSRPEWNRVLLYVWPRVDVPLEDFHAIAHELAPTTLGLGLEDVLVQAKIGGENGRVDEVIVRIVDRPGAGMELSIIDLPTEPMRQLNTYDRNVLRARRRGSAYPYELVGLVCREGGSFIEYDLDEDDYFAPVDRPPGGNTAGIVVGLVSTPTARYPEGMTRVALFGDPTKALGAISEPECRRIMAAIELADLMRVPVEWFTLSSGAKIAMDSGTENMDWVARVLRRIITFTQDGGEINIIVAGINVGAQPYWNAEATMLQHTKGILVMTPDSAMVLTGKQALDFSGGVSAEDNFGIGGHDRIMGPNGQAQYWASDLRGGIDVLFRHYETSYAAPGERFPRKRSTTDTSHRDVSPFPHVSEGSDLATVGDIFSEEANPDRKKPFDIRSVMNATIDQDVPPLERWANMKDAETVVVYDGFLGGNAVSVLGIESRPIQRRGLLPADGPDQWTAGTLFPMSSKKASRAINAASGSRPLVVLANLSGFDGSPESLSRLQLEYGAEIGRAIVNFDGPIVFCVISRYHGGAFVVFSKTLNDNMEVLAVEGTKASVLGGAPAAAVVFVGEVNKRTAADQRLTGLSETLASASEVERAHLEREFRDLREAIRLEKLGEVADEFDAVHSVERAMSVGSVDAIVPPSQLRSRLIESVERGMQRAQTRVAAASVQPAAAPGLSTPAEQPSPEPSAPAEADDTIPVEGIGGQGTGHAPQMVAASELLSPDSGSDLGDSAAFSGANGKGGDDFQPVDESTPPAPVVGSAAAQPTEAVLELADEPDLVVLTAAMATASSDTNARSGAADALPPPPMFVGAPEIIDLTDEASAVPDVASVTDTPVVEPDSTRLVGGFTGLLSSDPTVTAFEPSPVDTAHAEAIDRVAVAPAESPMLDPDGFPEPVALDTSAQVAAPSTAAAAPPIAATAPSTAATAPPTAATAPPTAAAIVASTATTTLQPWDALGIPGADSSAGGSSLPDEIVVADEVLRSPVAPSLSADELPAEIAMTDLESGESKEEAADATSTPPMPKWLDDAIGGASDDW